MKKLFLLIACIVLIAAVGCRAQAFEGTRTADKTRFLLDCSMLNETQTHEMELKRGAMVRASIAVASGRLDILVTDENGKELYKGNNASSGSFLLEIPEDAAYRFSVAGKQAKGSVAFAVED